MSLWSPAWWTPSTLAYNAVGLDLQAELRVRLIALLDAVNVSEDNRGSHGRDWVNSKSQRKNITDAQ